MQSVSDLSSALRSARSQASDNNELSVFMSSLQGAQLSDADFAEDGSRGNLLSRLHADATQVAVQTDQPLTVIDNDSVAVKVVVAGRSYQAIKRCSNRRAGYSGDVHALVW